MARFHSMSVAVFSTKISTMLGCGVLCFLGIGISALIMFSYSDPSSLFLGIQTASADLSMPPEMLSPEHQPIAEKVIFISLKDQTLVYKEGATIMGSFKISSGLRRTPTPVGEYTVLKKKPLVRYRGDDYDYPNTKWNLMFKPGKKLNYYIHGAYWHRNFGRPMSHGCVNVSYKNMEGLYNWAEEGTKIIIQKGSI